MTRAEGFNLVRRPSRRKGGGRRQQDFTYPEPCTVQSIVATSSEILLRAWPLSSLSTSWAGRPGDGREALVAIDRHRGICHSRSHHPGANNTDTAPVCLGRVRQHAVSLRSPVRPGPFNLHTPAP